MKLTDAYPGKYFKAEEISETGDVFTIASVELEELGQGADKQVKPVVYFEEDEKGFVINKTNFKSICEATGQGDSDDWVGHQITLFQTQVQFGADMVDTIRVKKKVNRSPAKTATAAAATPAATPKEVKHVDVPLAESQQTSPAESSDEFGAKSGQSNVNDDDIPF